MSRKQKRTAKVKAKVKATELSDIATINTEQIQSSASNYTSEVFSHMVNKSN
jgi:hypothetical protein